MIWIALGCIAGSFAVLTQRRPSARLFWGLMLAAFVFLIGEAWL